MCTLMGGMSDLASTVAFFALDDRRGTGTTARVTHRRPCLRHRARSRSGARPPCLMFVQHSTRAARVHVIGGRLIIHRYSYCLSRPNSIRKYRGAIQIWNSRAHRCLDAPSAHRQMTNPSLACNTWCMVRNLRTETRPFAAGCGRILILPATIETVVGEIALYLVEAGEFHVARTSLTWLCYENVTCR